MTVTLGTFSTNALLVQPFTYEGEARAGLTARTFRISGLLKPTEWQALITEYRNWYNLRITDEDTWKSGTVGTTVNLSISPANGLSITSLPCWFTEQPIGEQAGAYISVSVTLVDALQALRALLRQKEKERQNVEASTPDFGTITFGSCVVKLTKPMETRQDGPSVALTATGASYVTGPLVAHKIRQVEGHIEPGSTYESLLAWYDLTISQVPLATSWFPITPPAATAEIIVVDGVKTTRYSVSLTVLQII